MLEISADYTDYVCGSDFVRADQNTYPANRGPFVAPCCTASNRNLRNLCNLRIFNFGFSLSAVLALCLNNLRFT
jgi:hypothetical protein